MTFDEAFGLLLGHEGDFVDHPDDPGGKTRFGVTEAVAREAGYQGDMRELPVEVAKAIYRARYWDACKADDLPAGVRYFVFDAAVNSGVGQAVKWLQRAAGVNADGVVGPQTIAAASSLEPERLKAAMLGQRLRFMAQLANWPAFSRGWANRVADLLEVPCSR